MLHFLYNLFFPAKPKQTNEDEEGLMSCKVELMHDREFIGYVAPPIFQQESDILDLVKRFEEKTLPAHEWTHTAHLIVGFYYLKNYTWEEAQARLRASIIAYNEAVGITNSPTSGYHETITFFWLHFLKRFLAFELLDFCNIFSRGAINKNEILNFYSYECIQSTEARQNWVEPDKETLDFL